MSEQPSRVRLAVGLDGAGWYPAAWREPDARPAELFTARYWVELAREAEHGLIDLVTIEDSLGLQGQNGAEGHRRDRVRGRLDAVLIAARVAPLTSRVGLVPTVVATHTEPFRVSAAIATLDFASRGRAGVRVDVSARPQEAAHFGRRAFPRLSTRATPTPRALRLRDALWDEAADYVEVLRRLWDSWEDDAEIRDVATGRFVDRDRLHHIDFAGPRFRVRGPAITPRPPQGQPVVAALAQPGAPPLAGADLAFVAPRDAAHARALVAGPRASAELTGEPSHVFGDLVVFLDQHAGTAAARRALLEDAAGEHTSAAAVFAGTPAELARLAMDWARAGLSGLRLLPATIPHDLRAITRGLVPHLRGLGVYPHAYPADTLRGLLDLPRPVSRYAGSAR